ncbi:MAG: DUF2974 domain-containing protein [Planctomycetaceae bacterium]|jgi:hypothetical protein|nr:DUF2974 domain-containing protein [Planctomycetaceae bacterium]
MSEKSLSDFGGRYILSCEDIASLIRFQEYRCALVSDRVYRMGDLSEFGISLASSEQIGEVFGDSQILFLSSDGFRSRLYYDSHSDKYILGFGGTAPISISDWRTNFNQFFGKKAEEYVRGIELVGKIREDYVDRVIVTGHSLGGGIATVAAIMRKLRCFVFNPPAIHPNTLRQFEPLDYTEINNLITRYVVAGEALDLINKTVSIKHVRIGTKRQLYGSWRIPNLIGLFLGRKLISRIITNPIILLVSTIGIPLIEKSLVLHGMEEVLFGLKKYLLNTELT